MNTLYEILRRMTTVAILAAMMIGVLGSTHTIRAASTDSGNKFVANTMQRGAVNHEQVASDSNSDANQIALHADRVGQTQISIAMDNGQRTTAQQMASAGYTGIGIASAKGFNGHNWATTVWRNDERQQLIANDSTNTGNRHLAYGVATTFNPPGCQYMAATNETWTDGHLAWRDDANMGGAAMAATGHHRLRALRQYLLGYEIAMMWQPATRQQLQL